MSQGMCVPVEAGNDPRLIAGKKTGTSVLHTQRTKFCQQPAPLRAGGGTALLIVGFSLVTPMADSSPQGL